MKKNLVLLFIMMLSTNSITAQYFPVDTAKLNTAYRTLSNDTSNLEYQKAFSDAFPNNWKEFFMTYQFVPNKGYDLTMNKLANDQIQFFINHLNLINGSLHSKRIANLVLGATLNSDITRQLQYCLHTYMWKEGNMDKLLTAVSKLRNMGDQMQFWQFYWSTNAKNSNYEKEKDYLMKKNSANYPETVKIMTLAFDYFYNGVTAFDNFPKNK